MRKTSETVDPAHRPGPRLGPRPLPLHLAAPMMLYGASLSALPILKSGFPFSRPGFEATNLHGADWLNGFGDFLNASLFPWPEANHAAALKPLADLVGETEFPELMVSIDSVFREQLSAMMTGVGQYWAHPFHRTQRERKTVWQESGTRLLAFTDEAGRQPVLVVPSLVNKSYIMDLEEGCSFCDSLVQAGLCPYLIDWGEPGPAESGFGLTDYVDRLFRASQFLTEAQPDRKLGVVGYCMGGLLALALAVRCGDGVDRLVLMATPWDFHAGGAPGGHASALAGSVCRSIVSVFGNLPVDWIQTMFMSLDPLLAFRKFQQFAALDQASGTARRFVLLEDWLNDGVALSGPVAEETLVGWYAENTTGTCRWEIAGEVIDPGSYRGEALVVIPTADKIVPPESALAITERLQDVRLLRPALGHIGMMSSRGADALWSRVARFLV